MIPVLTRGPDRSHWEHPVLFFIVVPVFVGECQAARGSSGRTGNATAHGECQGARGRSGRTEMERPVEDVALRGDIATDGRLCD